ncbi:SDR family NAD(P)-dependent oxidoreductase [Sphingobium sp. Leaf26]|uniref:SDR family NAD(P)-dependent oxidoreductase n=1 Tax=Sphingobium sp. Leaf26 TaxID=1735693 RepID=UPI00138F65F4
MAQAIRDARGVTVETLAADFADALDLTRVTDRIGGDPRITMLVNNAGTATFAPVVETCNAAAAAMINVNVTALVQLMLALLPSFTARNSGTIVNIASVAALGELPRLPSTAVQKLSSSASRAGCRANWPIGTSECRLCCPRLSQRRAGTRPVCHSPPLIPPR